ncbi:MAG: hypothetical protein ACYDBB_25920 [Armatimonadota bacterium]
MPTYQTIRLLLPASTDPLIDHAVNLFRRIVTERGAATVAIGGTAVSGELTITLALDPALAAEGYRLEDVAGGGLCVAGADAHGVLYGIGRLLHDGHYAGGFTPGDWRGMSAPECPVRGMYLALHNNWYSFAPREEMRRYFEELALWGLNVLLFHLPQYEDPTTPAAQETYARNRDILRLAKGAGMKVALLKEPNIGFCTAPASIHGPMFPDATPARRGDAGTRICPSDPAGFAYLSKMLDDYLAAYQEIGVDCVVAFPYDSGGCGCDKCWPWGARGYVTISKEFSRLAHQYYPKSKFVLGVWCFDVLDEPDGEYAGLAEVLAEDAGWVDMIMADSHENFPSYPLEHGVPGGLPMINFAEISMWGRFPWGGTGANPLPERYQRLWNQAKEKLSGGFPYSEGNFEDINKVIFSQFFWHKDALATDTVRAYIAYEYAPEVVGLVAEAIDLLERTYPWNDWQQADAERAFMLIEQADALLPPYARTAWRWRIFYLRAFIDVELIRHNRVVTDRCDAAYEELSHIFHLETGWRCVAPPSRAFLAQQAAKDSGAISAPPPGADQGMVSAVQENAGVEALPPGAEEGLVSEAG